MRALKRYGSRLALGVGVALALDAIRASLAHAETLEDFSAYVVENVPVQTLDFLSNFDNVLAWIFGILVGFVALRFLVRNSGA